MTTNREWLRSLAENDPTALKAWFEEEHTDPPMVIHRHFDEDGGLTDYYVAKQVIEDEETGELIDLPLWRIRIDGDKLGEPVPYGEEQE